MPMQADLLSPPINFAVVQLPERKYPGVVVQGDTLHSLHQQAEQMAQLLSTGELDELADEIEALKELLSQALSHFEQVCANRNIDLPYQ